MDSRIVTKYDLGPGQIENADMYMYLDRIPRQFFVLTVARILVRI